MTIKTVTSSELRTNVKRVLNEVEYGAEHYIVEKFGAPTAAIISIEDFQLFQTVQAILDEVEKNGSGAAKRMQASHRNVEPNDRAVEEQLDPQQDRTIQENNRSMTQKEQVESLMQLLKNSERIPDVVKNYKQKDLISKLFALVQYLDAEVSRLEAKMGVGKESLQENEVTETNASGPFSGHWGKFVGAVTGETWERPEQGTLEVREEW